MVHLQLLSTPPRGDAVTFGYRPESVYLKGTRTPRIGYTLRRTSHAIHRVVRDAGKHHKPQRGDGSHRLRLRRPYRGWVEIGTHASTGCTRGYMPAPLPGLLARLSGAIWCRRIHRMNRTEHSLVLMGVRVSG